MLMILGLYRPSGDSMALRKSCHTVIPAAEMTKENRRAVRRTGSKRIGIAYPD